MPAQPAVLLSHGAFHTPAHYEPLTTALTHAGLRVTAPRHKTSSDPHATFEDDVAQLRAALHALAAAAHPILLLAHSYGGTVASEALGSGTGTGVLAIVYMASFLTRAGEPMARYTGRPAPSAPAGLLPAPAGDAALASLYHDVEPGLAHAMAETLVPMPLAPLLRGCGSVPGREGWRAEGVRVTYVVCEADRMLGVQGQWEMIRNARAEGVDVRAEVLAGASHSPFLSRVGEMVEIVGRAWPAGVAS